MKKAILPIIAFYLLIGILVCLNMLTQTPTVEETTEYMYLIPTSGIYDSTNDFYKNQVYIKTTASNEELVSFLENKSYTLDETTLNEDNIYRMTLDKNYNSKEELESLCTKLMNQYSILIECKPFGIEESFAPDGLEPAQVVDEIEVVEE